jgi:hypothetical protein
MLVLNKLHLYIQRFNQQDEEVYKNSISNAESEAFLAQQIPLLDCPDKTLEETYYFRWWTFRKHIQNTPDGHIITEFLPKVPWSGAYNSINCPVGFHLREGRWLKDSENILKEYIDFWLNEIGNIDCYTCWLPHAVLEYCTIKNDFAYGIACLPKLVAFFERREKEHRRKGGIYWSHDGYDGMEYSISGPGLRPTINAYAWADATAIAKLAAMDGNESLRKTYEDKATEIKAATETLLWDGAFYKTIPLKQEADLPCLKRPKVAPEHDVKELVGYIPWYFNMPPQGKESVFSELQKDDGFYATYGLTTAEQRHPRFMEAFDHECLWNGPVWPFATSQVLVAVANLLRRYPGQVLTKQAYYEMLSLYAASHRLTREDGTEQPWIDENMHPYTGRWLSRDILKSWDWRAEKGGYERGKDYNHSLFCDLVLSGLLGIDVEDGQFTISPLIPDDWNYFRVENLWLNDKCYRITFDRDGTHYGEKTGLYIDSV